MAITEKEIIEIKRSIASLNDAVTELVISCAQIEDNPVSKGWAHTMTDVLSRHTRNLGFIPQFDSDDISSWEGQV